MSCAVVSVNRTLGVLAAVWVMIPAMAVPLDAEPSTGEKKALTAVLEMKGDSEELCLPSGDEQPLSCTGDVEPVAASR